MQTENFSQTKIIELYNQCKISKNNNNCIVKLSNEIKQYVDSYFYHGINDKYYFWNGELKVFNVYNRNRVKNLFFNYFPKELRNYILKINSKLYIETINPNSKERIYDDDKINLFGGYVNVKNQFIKHCEKITY